MNQQLDLFSNSTGKVIETIHITPTKEMPIEVFRECYRFSYLAELLERTPDGKVIWDEECTTITAEGMADVIYQMVQDGMIEVNFEVPKEYFSDDIDTVQPVQGA